MKNKTNAVSHTPTPWSLGKTGNVRTGLALCKGSFAIGEVYGTGYQGGWSPEAQSDAEFIVRAVNSHESLVNENRILGAQLGFQTERNDKLVAENVSLQNLREDLVHTLANALHELRSLNANEFLIKQCEQAIAKAEGK